MELKTTAYQREELREALKSCWCDPEQQAMWAAEIAKDADSVFGDAFRTAESILDDLTTALARVAELEEQLASAEEHIDELLPEREILARACVAEAERDMCRESLREKSAELAESQRQARRLAEELANRQRLSWDSPCGEEDEQSLTREYWLEWAKGE